LQQFLEKKTPSELPPRAAEAEAVDPSRSAALRGMTYDEGVAQLSPNASGQQPVQMEAKESTPSTDPEAAAAAEAAKQKETERVAAAKASWEKMFGETVGSWLFSQIREHVSAADLLDYGKEGTKAMADAAGGMFSATDGMGGLIDTDKEAAALNKFLGAVGPKVQELTDKWLASKSGQKVLTAISQFTEEHPLIVVSSVGAAAIGAAIAAYCANVDIPEFEKMFKIGKTGLSAGGSIDLGKIQKLAVQAATLTVKYERGKFNVSVSGSQDKEGEHSGKLSVAHSGSIGDTEMSGKGLAKIKEDGTVELEVDGGLKTLVAGTPLDLSLSGKHSDGNKEKTSVGGSLIIGDAKGEHQKLSGEYDAVTGALRIRTDYKADGNTYYTEDKRNAEGDVTNTRGLNLQLGENTDLSLKDTMGPEGYGAYGKFSAKDIGGSGLTASLGHGSGTLEGTNLGLAYKSKVLTSSLDLALKPGGSSLTHSTDYKANGLTAGYNFDINLSDGRLQELGAKFGWDDPEQFRGFLASYKRSWLSDKGAYSDEFDLRIDATLGNLATRFEGEIGLQGGNAMSAGADLTLGYPLNSDWMLLGGVGYSASMGTGAIEHDPRLGIGVQYKNVGLMMNYHPMSDGTEMMSLGIVIPLGRR
jgi:hypothetical protein